VFKKLLLCVAVVASTTVAEGAEWQYAKLNDHYGIPNWMIEFPGVTIDFEWELYGTTSLNQEEYVYINTYQNQSHIPENHYMLAPDYTAKSYQLMESILGFPIDQHRVNYGMAKEGIAMLGRAGFEMFEIEQPEDGYGRIYWFKRRID
jgi:hypothetical protein